MSRSRLSVLLQMLLSVAAMASVVWSVPATPTVGVELAANWGLALAFAGSSLVLAIFSVWLPRGDIADTTAALSFAAGAVLQPFVAVAVVSAARILASLAKRPGLSAWSVLENLSRRALLVSLVYAIVRPGVLGDLASPAPPVAVYSRLAVAAVGFFVLDLLVEQAHASVRHQTPYFRGLLSSLRVQGWMTAAQMSVGVLAVMLLPGLGSWGLVISAGLLLVMRQSFALLLEVRASYTATVEMLARSIEAYDPSRRGHAERVSRMVGDAGHMLGWQGKKLESLVYAALFHDVGRLGSDNPEEAPSSPSSEVLKGVGFLSGAVPILQIIDTAAESESSLDEQDLVGAYLVAHFSALDSESSFVREQEQELAASIGARLYANTRAGVDRVVRRVERRVRVAGSGTSEALR